MRTLQARRLLFSSLLAIALRWIGASAARAKFGKASKSFGKRLALANGREEPPLNPSSEPPSRFARLRSLVALLLCILSLGLAGVGLAARFGPFVVGGADINLITGVETSPRVTQNTSALWSHGNRVVVLHDDSSGGGLNPQSFCGVSVSTDGGATFARLPEKFNSGGACYGEPSIVYSVRAGLWFASFLSGRCGGRGIGQWISGDGGITWSNAGCVATGNPLDLPSRWVDNNFASPFFGRQYALFNDASNGLVVRSTYSINDGATWESPITVQNSERRAVDVSGSFGADGTVVAQTLDEGGYGFSAPRQNFIHRSTDGAVTWSPAIAQGGAFLPPGRAVCSNNSFFNCIYAAPSQWRDIAMGQAGVGPNGVVHYVYGARTASDPGNIFYIRSADNGSTWSPPLQLNSDATLRAQWRPSLSVNAQGKLFVSWNDERNTANDSLERFGRASQDNGVTWENDMPLSDVVFPKPLQPDPNVDPTNVGFYNRGAFSNDGNGGTAYHTWVDGRVAINGSPQQDVFLDKIFFFPEIIVSGAGSSVVAAGANGVLEPGETVTVALAVRNVGTPGTCTTSALTGTLQTTGGVTNPTAPAQNYGMLCGGDPPVVRNFTFTVSPSLACGLPVTASLVMTDGPTNYGVIVYTFGTGTPIPTFSQNFDGVVAPALPAGWVATNAAGPAPLWVTSTATPDTAPNAAFVDDPVAVSDKRLDTPAIPINSASAQVSFRNNYDLEYTYDGGVLEVSSPNINGGAFTDITNAAVGGSFASGGYIPFTISAITGNPIGGRMAWSGFSGGYITTVANLGPNVAGQTIKLRFRMGSDNGVSGTGWRIDTLSITERFCAPTFTITTIDDHNDGICNTADCTLREAITAANLRGGSLIGFAPGVTGTIQLNSTLPSISSNIAFQGPGANLLTVRRNIGFYRIFTVNPGAVASFSGLTIANGDASGFTGGGIFSDHAVVSLTRCVVTGNTAFSGGGIFSQGSTSGTAGLTINDSTISGNSASGSLGVGGGIYSQGVNSGTAFLSLTNSTVSGNTAVAGAAGIENFGSNGTATATVRNCTFSGNTFFNDQATLLVANTIFNAGTGTSLANFNGTITSQGHNISSDAVGGDGTTGPGGLLSGVADRRNTNPQLDPAGLANNGGQSRTIALQATSPAINGGDDNLAPLRDQRGYTRSGLSDVGAFEFGGLLLPLNAVSRKAHGSAVFDLGLPLTGAAGIECRTGGVNGDHQIIIAFSSPVTVTSASVTTGIGSVSSVTVSGPQVTVSLTGVANAQTIVLTLVGVSDGVTSTNVTISMGVLLGDTTGNGSVTASDIGQTKAQSGQPVTAANFRTDVTANNAISASDIGLVKSQSGTQLP